MLLWNKLIFLCFAPTTCFTYFTDALVWRQLAWPVPTPAPNDRGTPSQHRPVIGDHLIGATPFALAAKFAEGEIMRTLAAAGADGVLPLRNGWTPLMLASGASWRYGVWDRRDRALHRDFAFQAEHIDEAGTLDAVRAALEAGADLNAADETGNRALHYVVDKRFRR